MPKAIWNGAVLAEGDREIDAGLCKRLAPPAAGLFTRFCTIAL